jgi:uncharacterized protein (TIGR02145 family)
VVESSSSLEIESSSSIALSSSSETPTVKSIYDAENNTLTDLRDNKVYKTVTIGEQIWTAENMNYKYKAGSKSFCYNNSEKYCSLYGRLYTSDSKNVICPEKWHLPDSTEWETLFEFTGRQAIVLKADSGWIPFGTEDTNGTNDFGFAALPAGYVSKDGNHSDKIKERALFWSSSKEKGKKSKKAFARMLEYGDESFHENKYSTDNAFSVRCLKD